MQSSMNNIKDIKIYYTHMRSKVIEKYFTLKRYDFMNLQNF